ncbi:hypothetical protein [Myceligenerans salitolerans]|uniref:Aminoacyl-tRNA synthetase class I anticodon-binding domain-containing protein n=1 Tax=Myceligenerans salitolerans TaxID=1230528 RepID=A0ABS3IDF0_9MICO|nr:hypothetical protein [Myceligenerans salitolerans]MBO0611067.1 hypothetical protein [Myceligenerans salitolerans]
MSVDAFTDAVQPWLTSDDVPWPAEAYDPAVFDAVAELVQTRIVLLGDVVEMLDFLFLDQPAIDEAAWDKAMGGEHAADILAATIERYEAIDWSAGALTR